MTFNDALSQYPAQLPSLTANGQEYFPPTPNTLFSSHTPAPSRGFTNRSRRIPPTRQPPKQSSPHEDSDFLPPSPNENARKRTSKDFAIRHKKRKSLRCEDPACHNRTFADEPNLNRHMREVHGQAQYHCPVMTCERHSRGFKRRDNCINHQKRSHGSLGLQSPTKSSSAGVSPRLYSSSLPLLTTTDEGGGGGGGGGGVLSSNNEDGTDDDDDSGGGSGGGGGAEDFGEGLMETETLVQKMECLKRLLKKRRRVEVEIARVKGELQQALVVQP